MRMVLRVGGLNDLQIDRLVVVRHAVRTGELHEETMANLRLLFGRWLFEHGRLTEEVA